MSASNASLHDAQDDAPELPGDSSGAFNLYHTEVVKHDAINSAQMANGDLVKQRIGGHDDGDDDDDAATAADQLDQFALLKCDYETIERMVQRDSVNVV